MKIECVSRTGSGCRQGSLAETVERACHLVALGDEVASAIVVPGRRPRFDELLSIRESTAQLPLELQVRADGSISVRRTMSEAEPPKKPYPTVLRMLMTAERRAVSIGARTGSGLVNWNAGFQGLKEGIR